MNYIQWTGENLYDVISFTGRHSKFQDWFRSFEDYERHVKESGNFFKLFYYEGESQYVPVGYWLIKNEDGSISVYDHLPLWVE